MPVGYRDVAAAVTALGDSGYMLVGSACSAAFAWWVGRRTSEGPARHRMRRAVDGALLVFVAVATSGLAVQLLKHTVGRARPRLAGGAGAFSFHPVSLGNGFASFPSGHTTSAFAAATALAFLVPRGRVALFALAAAIGASRVVVGEHYPSDVVGGAALGIVTSLALARRSAVPASVRALRAGVGGPADPARSPGRSRGVAAFGRFASDPRHRFLPALAAGAFALAVPPTDLFGSEAAEHVKDGVAILVALAGLTLRSLAIGFGPAAHARGTGATPTPVLVTGGAYALCRNPFHAGSVLIYEGVFLMHGNRWTVLFGTLATLVIHLAVVRAEEEDLLQTFGAAYADYARRVRRWVPDPARLRRAMGGSPFDLRGALRAEYPVIGLTVIALAVAEAYEEIQEPLVGSQGLHLVILGLIVLAATLAMATAWLRTRGRLTIRA